MYMLIVALKGGDTVIDYRSSLIELIVYPLLIIILN